MKEVKGDLFSFHGNLCHCVSADFEMSKGIAVTFKKQFGRVDELLSQQVDVGGIGILLDVNTNKQSPRTIYYLVTKAKYWQKPTLETLTSSLIQMRDHALKTGVNKIAMPRIGCGLDRLNWSDVKQILIDIFENSGIEITVYYL